MKKSILIILLGLIITSFYSCSDSTVNPPNNQGINPDILYIVSGQYYMYKYVINIDGTGKNLLEKNTQSLFPSHGKMINLKQIQGGLTGIYIGNLDNTNMKLVYESNNVANPEYLNKINKIAFSGDVWDSVNSSWISGLFLMNDNGSNIIKVSDFNIYTFNYTFSDDQTKLLIVNSNLNDSLCVMNIDGTNKKFITNKINMNVLPAISPDNNEIVGIKYDNKSIFVVNIDGSNYKEYRLSDEYFFNYPIWSPDGTQIIYSKLNLLSKESGIYTINSDLTNEQILFSDSSYVPKQAQLGVDFEYLSLSTDKKKLLFVEIFMNPDLLNYPSGQIFILDMETRKINKLDWYACEAYWCK